MLPQELERLALNGNPLNVEAFCSGRNWDNNQNVRVYDKEDRFIGVYKYRAGNQTLRLEKMFLET